LGGAEKIRCVTKIDTPHGVNAGLPPADALIRILRTALVLLGYSQFVPDKFDGERRSKGMEKEYTSIGESYEGKMEQA
jgi:hypothetical protein